MTAVSLLFFKEEALEARHMQAYMGLALRPMDNGRAIGTDKATHICSQGLGCCDLNKRPGSKLLFSRQIPSTVII